MKECDDDMRCLTVDINKDKRAEAVGLHLDDQKLDQYIPS